MLARKPLPIDDEFIVIYPSAEKTIFESPHNPYLVETAYILFCYVVSHYCKNPISHTDKELMKLFGLSRQQYKKYKDILLELKLLKNIVKIENKQTKQYILVCM